MVPPLKIMSSTVHKVNESLLSVTPPPSPLGRGVRDKTDNLLFYMLLHPLLLTLAPGFILHSPSLESSLRKRGLLRLVRIYFHVFNVIVHAVCRENLGRLVPQGYVNGTAVLINTDM